MSKLLALTSIFQGAVGRAEMDRLPQGIYFRSGQRPADFFRLATFNFTPSATRESAFGALATLWDVLAGLKQGIILDLRKSRDADPEIRVDPGNLTATLCIGPRLFRAAGRQRALVDLALKPDGFGTLSEVPSGPFSALKWGPTAAPRAAQTDFAIQLIADTELSVARAIVEMQKAIDDEGLPVQLVCFFSGLHRDDGRSWIDFHDGINNMRSSERPIAIEIAQSPQAWLQGGTTMAFLKIGVDLTGWRKLSREQQEALVGRDKLSGCPIEQVSVDGGVIRIQHAADCPTDAQIDRTWPPHLLNPPFNTDAIVASSHIHRANKLRQGPETDAPRRLYRQGYEFVDSPPDGGVRVGLNFVSFQRSLELLRGILGTNQWMGDANFGGSPNDPSVPAFPLMSVVAGGFFAVPPEQPGEDVPGSALFSPG